MTRIEIYFDGACKNVKDSVNEMYGCGVSVHINSQISKEHSISKGFKEGGTSNIAEWEACLLAFQKAEQLFHEIDDLVDIKIFSDSEVITKQFNGEYQTREPRFLKYRNECILISRRIKYGYINWIPREHNKEADQLSKQALNSIRNDSK